MIAGVGIDIVSISRIERLIRLYGDRFLGKVFTERERDEGLRKAVQAPFFAARFAAREAFYKAIGTGWGRGLSLKEVSVSTGEAGRPLLDFGERISEEIKGMGIYRWHVSLTHDGDSAIAIVILETP
jgi:holo-[acyl-carrier protein] synthase